MGFLSFFSYEATSFERVVVGKCDDDKPQGYPQLEVVNQVSHDLFPCSRWSNHVEEDNEARDKTFVCWGSSG